MIWGTPGCGIATVGFCCPSAWTRTVNRVAAATDAAALKLMEPPPSLARLNHTKLVDWANPTIGAGSPGMTVVPAWATLNGLDLSRQWTRRVSAVRGSARR